MGFCCPPVAADVGPAGGGLYGGLQQPPSPLLVGSRILLPPWPLIEGKAWPLGQQWKKRSLFYLQMPCPWDIGWRSRAVVLGSITSPCCAQGLPSKGRGQMEAGKGRCLHNEHGCQRGQEPFSRTTLLEAFWWPPPFGVHFSSNEGMV